MRKRAWAGIAGVCVAIALLVLVWARRSRGGYRYQHCDVLITEKNYAVVTDTRRRLIAGVTSALERHRVRYVLGHGNLLEFVRGEPIVHDDDVDIRIHRDDLDRWMGYCLEAGEKDEARALSLRDARRTDRGAQARNGMQLWLLDDPHPHFDVHVDVVSSTVPDPVWIDYHPAFETPLRRTTYLGVLVWVPSAEAARKLLIQEYGIDYLVPDAAQPVSFDVRSIYDIQE